MTNWLLVLLEPAKSILSQIGQFLANVLLVIVILIIGWVISKFIKTVIEKVLRAIKLDDLSGRLGLDNLLEKGGMKYSLSELIGVIGYWLALLVTFVVAVNAIGLTIAASLIEKVVLYVPNIIAAIFILILGMFLATLLKNIVQTAARNAGLTQANFLAKVTEVIVIAFAVLITLEQLKIGISITEITLSIILGSVGLALALAVGLGCKDIVARFVADFFEKIKSK